MLFRYNLDSSGKEIQALIAESAALIESGNTVFGETAPVAIPPFVAVDHEGGLVNRFRPGVADLPPAASYQEIVQSRGREAAVAQIYTDSLNAGKIIHSMGINLNFAPVAEALNEGNSDFLEARAYSVDPVFTAKASAAFIMGMEQAGLLCAIKHFPGSTGADPHFFPSVLQGDRKALSELTSPFAALIKDGHARALMVSHSAVPSWDSHNIASLSPAVMGEWLRQELGFSGIIVCDDFSMNSAAGVDGAKPEIAAVRALAAGGDMVLVWPPDLRRTHRELQAALLDGRLSRERLREAAERVLFEKIRIKLVDQ